VHRGLSRTTIHADLRVLQRPAAEVPQDEARFSLPIRDGSLRYARGGQRLGRNGLGDVGSMQPESELCDQHEQQQEQRYDENDLNRRRAAVMGPQSSDPARQSVR
jgi:hypothetical protein